MNRGYLPSILLPFFHVLNAAGKAEDLSPSADQIRANLFVKVSARLALWFTKAYGPYLPPVKALSEDVEIVIEALRKNPLSDAVRRSARKAAIRRASTMKLSEDETRVIIDHQLRAAGWQADTWSLRYSLGARPEKNTSKAIAEWPTESGPADYALFCGLDFVGVVEAKKMGKDVLSDLESKQALQPRCPVWTVRPASGGPWGELPCSVSFFHQCQTLS